MPCHKVGAMRTMYWIGVLAVGMLWLAGCNGDSRHEVDTTGDGSLTGMSILPAPQTLKIDTSEKFYLDWSAGYDPPAHLRMILESVSSDGNTTGVNWSFKERSFGHYTIDPNSSLPAKTFLLLRVLDDSGHEVRAMYLTEDSGIFPDSVKETPNGSGQAEHVVNTRE